MSATSRIAYNRSRASQPAANLYGPMGASALSNTDPNAPSLGVTPSSTQAAQGNPATAGQGATFLQLALGLLLVWAAWWMITLVLERLLPLKDTPEFLREWLHGFRIALLVGGWFVFWKMSAGVWPFNQAEPYRTVVLSF